jgi:anti-anti-sigma factor
VIFEEPDHLSVTVTVTVRRGVTVVSVVGELDGMVADLLRRHFAAALAAAADALVLDLGKVSFCSAAILRVLLQTTAAAAEAGVACAIVGDHRAVVRPIELAGLGSVLRPLASVDLTREPVIVDSRR